MAGIRWTVRVRPRHTDWPVAREVLAGHPRPVIEETPHELVLGAAHEAEVPDECPQCGGELLRRCKACDAPFSSIAAVDCEECGEPLRADELFGSKIRRAPKNA